MQNTIQKFEELTKKKESLSKDIVRLETETTMLEKEYNTNLDTLKSTFGVSSIEEAREKAETLKVQIEEKVNKLEAELNAIEL